MFGAPGLTAVDRATEVFRVEVASVNSQNLAATNVSEMRQRLENAIQTAVEVMLTWIKTLLELATGY